MRHSPPSPVRSYRATAGCRFDRPLGPQGRRRRSSRSSHDRAEHGDGARVGQLGLGEAAGQHRDRRDAGAFSAACTSHGVSPTITASSVPSLLQRRADEVGLGLRAPRRRPTSSSRRRARARRAGRGSGRPPAASPSWRGRPVRPRSFRSSISSRAPSSSRRRLDSREVERALGGADVVAAALLDLLARHRRDELVAAHADVAVDPPDRQHDAVLAERHVPGHRVLVVRVDEGAVDVEDRCGRHGAIAYPGYGHGMHVVHGDGDDRGVVALRPRPGTPRAPRRCARRPRRGRRAHPRGAPAAARRRSARRRRRCRARRRCRGRSCRPVAGSCPSSATRRPRRPRRSDRAPRARARRRRG